MHLSIYAFIYAFKHSIKNRNKIIRHMKRITIIFLITTTLGFNIFSQGKIEDVLSGIEKNNTMLSALQKSAEAEKLGNKTGIYLRNPEIEFHYLRSNPSVIGNRTDVTIKQSFDFPTAYRYKNQISDIKNQQVEVKYRIQLRTLLLQARLVCIELIYKNALKSELSQRLLHSQIIANSYKSKFDLGESNILDYNKAQLNLLNISKELEVVDIERNELLSELITLNGGVTIDFIDSVFQTPEIPVDFEKWYLNAEQKNPVLNWLQQEIEKGHKQEKFNRAMSLPKLQAGYMSESIVGEQFQGIIVGLSIPLWENKNTVKFAKANVIAYEGQTINNRVMLYNKLKALHTKAIGLQISANDYRFSLNSFNHSSLLKKAFDKGEITLINYILELSIYYKSVDNLLILDRDLNSTLAELNQYL